MKLWVDPMNPDDYVNFPVLPARWAGEQEYDKLVA